MSHALIVVDVQNDFCEGGSLPVSGGADVAAAVSVLMSDQPNGYAHVVATKDYHISPGSHFSHPSFEVVHDATQGVSHGQGINLRIAPRGSPCCFLGCRKSRGQTVAERR